MTVGSNSSFISGRSCIISATTQVISFSQAPWVKIAEADDMEHCPSQLLAFCESSCLLNVFGPEAFLQQRQTMKLCINSTCSWLISPSKHCLFKVLNSVGKAADSQLPLSDICIWKVNDQKSNTVSLDDYKDLNTFLYLPEFSYPKLTEIEHPFFDIMYFQFWQLP